MQIFPVSFYEQPTVLVAQQLLGAHLVYTTSHATFIGKIVETEAYLGAKDPAAHSFGGITKRTEALFGPPGTAYLYLIYGLHYCLNVVTYQQGRGEAVLLRALEPIAGITQMQQNRRQLAIPKLTNGPAKLVQSFGIPFSLNGHNLQNPPLQITKGEYVDPGKIVTTTRIGITKAADLPLRFYLGTSHCISRK